MEPQKYETEIVFQPVGSKQPRATSYDVKYCDMLINHMAEGMSIEAFAGKIRVSKQTIYNWMKMYDEFREAKAIGDACIQYYLENLANDAMNGAIENFNTVVWIFKMKNLCGWKDKVEIGIGEREVKKVICNNLNISNVASAPELEGGVDA
jgi:predicted adenine nucleotide alpha hydrolase (AANH) superfamily ATPase